MVVVLDVVFRIMVHEELRIKKPNEQSIVQIYVEKKVLEVVMEVDAKHADPDPKIKEDVNNVV